MGNSMFLLYICRPSILEEEVSTNYHKKSKKNGEDTMVYKFQNNRPSKLDIELIHLSH